VRYERVNSETGEEVPWKEIVKGFEYAKGSYVVIDEEEIRKAAPESTESVEIEAFCNRDEIDPMYFEKPYYLVPTKKAEKGYVLLREVLAKTNKIGIARVVDHRRADPAPERQEGARAQGSGGRADRGDDQRRRFHGAAEAQPGEGWKEDWRAVGGTESARKAPTRERRSRRATGRKAAS
jgi:hypothetical protein